MIDAGATPGLGGAPGDTVGAPFPPPNEAASSAGTSPSTAPASDEPLAGCAPMGLLCKLVSDLPPAHEQGHAQHTNVGSLVGLHAQQDTDPAATGSALTGLPHQYVSLPAASEAAVEVGNQHCTAVHPPRSPVLGGSLSVSPCPAAPHAGGPNPDASPTRSEHAANVATLKQELARLQACLPCPSNGPPQAPPLNLLRAASKARPREREPSRLLSPPADPADDLQRLAGIAEAMRTGASPFGLPDAGDADGGWGSTAHSPHASDDMVRDEEPEAVQDSALPGGAGAATDTTIAPFIGVGALKSELGRPVVLKHYWSKKSQVDLHPHRLLHIPRNLVEENLDLPLVLEEGINIQIEANEVLEPVVINTAVAVYQNSTGHSYYRILGFKPICSKYQDWTLLCWAAVNSTTVRMCVTWTKGGEPGGRSMPLPTTSLTPTLRLAKNKSRKRAAEDGEPAGSVAGHSGGGAPYPIRARTPRVLPASETTADEALAEMGEAAAVAAKPRSRFRTHRSDDQRQAQDASAAGASAAGAPAPVQMPALHLNAERSSPMRPPAPATHNAPGANTAGHLKPLVLQTPTTPPAGATTTAVVSSAAAMIQQSQQQVLQVLPKLPGAGNGPVSPLGQPPLPLGLPPPAVHHFAPPVKRTAIHGPDGRLLGYASDFVAVNEELGGGGMQPQSLPPPPPTAAPHTTHAYVTRPDGQHYAIPLSQPPGMPSAPEFTTVALSSGQGHGASGPAANTFYVSSAPPPHGQLHLMGGGSGPCSTMWATSGVPHNGGVHVRTLGMPDPYAPAPYASDGRNLHYAYGGDRYMMQHTGPTQAPPQMQVMETVYIDGSGRLVTLHPAQPGGMMPPGPHPPAYHHHHHHLAPASVQQQPHVMDWHPGAGSIGATGSRSAPAHRPGVAGAQPGSGMVMLPLGAGAAGR